MIEKDRMGRGKIEKLRWQEKTGGHNSKVWISFFSLFPSIVALIST
jgi:hypothetical protein